MALYETVVIDHYQHPRNRGQLKRPDKSFVGAHVSCGDELTVQVKLGADKKIIEVAWNGTGCALSQAAASRFSELMIGKTIEQIRALKAEQLLKALTVKDLTPSRLKCALLPLYTLKGEREPIMGITLK